MKFFSRFRNAVLVLALVGLLANGGCKPSSSSSSGDDPNYNPPADHKVEKGGFLHKSGLRDPEANCTECHGDDLRGGDSAVSCYECHGKKW
jgi:hypothetical protein